MYFVCKFLVDAGLYESEEEAAKREEVLGRIKEVIGVLMFLLRVVARFMSLSTWNVLVFV